MPDPGLPGAILLVAALSAAAVGLWLLDRRARGGKRASSAMHSMGRDESISYFRDYGAGSSAPGVHEEDRAGRWGQAERDEPSR